MEPAADLKEQQKRHWGDAADSWERHNAWFQAQTQALNDWMCQAAELRPGMRVLDLACGSGHPALSAAKLVGPTGTVTATDISQAMVEVTKRIAVREAVTNIQVRVMDAEAIDFPDDSFDAVTMRLGLMFCPDPIKAAMEIRRVLRPSGRFAIAVWDLPVRNPFISLVTQALAQHLSTPAPDPGAPGQFRLSPPGTLQTVLQAAGLAEVEISTLEMMREYDSPDDFWAIQTELVAQVKTAVAALPPAQVALLKDNVLQALQPHVRNGMVRLASTALCASGTKSA